MWHANAAVLSIESIDDGAIESVVHAPRHEVVVDLIRISDNAVDTIDLKLGMLMLFYYLECKLLKFP